MSRTGRSWSCALALGLSGCGASEASFSFVDLPGLEQAIASRRGTPLLVNFWAIWCDPCVEELPALVAVGQGLRARGGEVLGVSFDLMAPETTREGLKRDMPAFLVQTGVDFPILIYDDGDPAPVIEKYELPGPIPVTLAISAAGRIVGMHEGFAERADFEELAERAVSGEAR